MSELTAREFFAVIAARYEGKADDFVVSVGHAERPFPQAEVSIWNLPEILGQVSIELGDIRRWAK